MQAIALQQVLKLFGPYVDIYTSYLNLTHGSDNGHSVGIDLIPLVMFLEDTLDAQKIKRYIHFFRSDQRYKNKLLE